ncbi:Tyrosine-protein kinase transforming protein SEA [Geodia barretti]|uniref:Tyrosine-protein kinase transforming protein SEA n=1 Tax=Geodia barretti TaxID=519541 RepID=A0AA35TH99_GEOBA|nr:Tyrosine-protein kinase transforming protein SEA [Geodia barretti]
MMPTVMFMKWNALITGDCGDPPEVENGLISYISFNATTTVTYECADGYYLQEGIEYSTSRTCLTSGNWSKENILCNAECGDPPELQNGGISYLDKTFVSYDCIGGYQFQEGVGYSTSRTCLTSGNWTNETILCNVDCGNPPELQNGEVSMNTTTENSVVTYKCINGYHFHENITSRTCLASGNWTEGNISCIKIDDNYCEGSDCGLSAGVLAAIICGAVFIPLSCLVAVAGCVVRLRLRKLKKSENILSLTSTEASTLPLHHTNTNQSPVQQLREELRTKNMLIPKSQLRLGRVVGQGESGIVYCGYMKSIRGNEVVAVKTGKALLAVKDKDRLLKEVLLMLNFNHPNVMSLIGLSFEGETPLLIMPFMSKGNVLGYVREHRETLFLTDIDHEKVQEATKTGLGMCYQISKGMAYLAKFKFVHRDLGRKELHD